MTRKIAVALDESPASNIALEWAASYVISGARNKVYLVSVLAPPQPAVPVMPVAAGPAAIYAVQQHWQVSMLVLGTNHLAPEESSTVGMQQVQKQEEEQTMELLENAGEALTTKYKVSKESVHTILLPALGGASGVAESLVEFTKRDNTDLLVVGSRGMGSVKRSLMSMIGLGSVSDYCVQHALCPVLVVRIHAGEQAAEALPVSAPVQKKVCVAYDDSDVSQKALVWAVHNFVSERDQLHVVVVATPVPYPVLDEPAAIIAMEIQQVDKQNEQEVAYCKTLVGKALAIAEHHGVPHNRVVGSVLTPKAGASDVGAAICQYAKEIDSDVVVLGSRGMGAFKRVLMGAIGLGSVSTYCIHHLHCPVTIIKASAAGSAAPTSAQAPASAPATPTPSPAPTAAPASGPAEQGAQCLT